MPARDGIVVFLLLFFILCLEPQLSLGGGGACELAVRHNDVLYNYSLSSPTSKYPHGILSEDGFYKVVVNETSLWFQLCDQMIFNHDPPRCYDCQDCGGPLHCGMACSALVSNDIDGYPVCTTIGRASSLQIALIGNCDYAVVLRHPSGCAKVINIDGGGWGWFGTLMMIILCLLVGYILVGTVYRFFFLGIHGAEAIPNLEFWFSLPRRAKSMLGNLLRRFSRQGRNSRGSYTPVNY